MDAIFDFAKNIVNARYEDLPAAAVEAAKNEVLDTLGTALGGSSKLGVGELVDIGDLTALIAYLYIPPNPVPVCFEEANLDGDVGGIVDIGDLTAIIAYLYIPPNPVPASCP